VWEKRSRKKMEVHLFGHYIPQFLLLFTAHLFVLLQSQQSLELGLQLFLIQFLDLSVFILLS
jgi:hypothetical protein